MMPRIPQIWQDFNPAYPASAARMTNIENDLFAVVNSFVNVKSPAFGAVGDGVTNDTTAIQAAIDSGTGVVVLPAGTFLCSSLNMRSNSYLQGAGEGLTIIKSASSGPLLKFWGTATGPSNHLTFAGARGLTLDGNNLSGALIDMVYCSRLVFYDIHCTNNPSVTIDTVEVWDSRFYNVSCNLCGSTIDPAIRIGSSRALSGFGSSSDSTNQLMFFGLLVETWKAGAIVIDPGTGGSLLHQLYFFGVKIETVFLRKPAITVSGNTRDVHIDDVWVYMGGFDSGFSTAQHAIAVHGDRNISVVGAFISNGAVATIVNCIDVFNAGSYIDQVYANLTTAPTGSVIAVAGGTDHVVGHAVLVGPGLLFSGNLITTPVSSRPIRAVAGVVSDASFLSPPLIGTLAVDVTNNRLYVKTAAATWLSAGLA